MGAAPSDAAEPDAGVGQHAGRGGPSAARSNGAGGRGGGGAGRGGRGGRGGGDGEGHTVDLPPVLRRPACCALHTRECEQKQSCAKQTP